MPSDISGVLQSTVTKTASFNSTGYNIPTGTPKRGLIARFVIASHISAATAGATFTPSIEQSDDNTTFVACASGLAVTGGTAAVTTQVPVFVHFFTKKAYCRSVMTITATGTPSIIYSADLVSADQ